MLPKIAGSLAVLLAMGQPALTQGATVHKTSPHARHLAANFPDDRAVEESVANLTVKAAFTPTATLSRQDFFALLLLMSAKQNGAHNSSPGAKP